MPRTLVWSGAGLRSSSGRRHAVCACACKQDACTATGSASLCALRPAPGACCAVGGATVFGVARSRAVALVPLQQASAACLSWYATPCHGACRRCPDGSYSRPGASECTPCPGGTFRNNFEDLDNNGYTKDDASVSLCYQCPVGYFAPREGLTRCRPCAAGHVAPALRSTKCTACSRGTFSMERISENADVDGRTLSDTAIAGDDFGAANTPWLDTQMAGQATCSPVPQGVLETHAPAMQVQACSQTLTSAAYPSMGSQTLA